MASKSLFATAFLMIALMPVLRIQALRCYVHEERTASEATSKLPATAKAMDCPYGEKQCMKYYDLKITQDSDTGKEIRETTFRWGCATFGNLFSSTARSNAQFEFTTGSIAGTVTTTQYTRACLCEGEECNSADMDRTCNEEPDFTHECYSDDRAHKPSTPLLPNEAVIVPCTATQACVKYSHFENDTDERSQYQWGCMTAPLGKCDFEGHAYSENMFEKVCMCCGDRCNGKQLDNVVADDESCGSPLSHKCLSYTGHSPILPRDQAKEEVCAMGETMCMKSYDMDVTKKNGREETQITYTWGCATMGKLLAATTKCGARLEITTGGAEENKEIINYNRKCLCCGDLCNTEAMNGECNEEPDFTHQCYSADNFMTSDDPHLPTTALKVPCTEKQSCMKLTHYHTANKVSNYQWGCFSTPNAQCDWGSSNVVDGTLEKACMCCGELCNGERMDKVLAEDSGCATAMSRKCYTASGSTSGNLPANTVSLNCFYGETRCMKMYTKTTLKDAEGKETTEETYDWGCAHFGQLLMANAKCDGMVEIGNAEVATAGGHEISYRRACLCCGDNCNNANMDTTCNEQPQYTHQCMAIDQSETADIPTTAISIGCTAKQGCFKFSKYDNETDESSYQWGCITAPNGNFEFSRSGRFGEALEKGCMCSGENCNGKKMDGISANTEYCSAAPPVPTTPKPEPLKCYKATATVAYGMPASLPADAKLVLCQNGETSCLKSYALVITNKDGEETKEVAYTWSCATYGNLMTATAPCGAKFELTTGGPNPEGNGTIAAYTRSCLCCGDECNGKAMNDECNDSPVFTHKCYSNDIGFTESMTAELPITSLEVPATASQACMKFSRNDNATDKSSYRWGAVSAPKGKCDWIGTNIEEGRFEKACLCCGDLCNGRRMNSIIAKTIDCNTGPQTTPQTAKLACYTHQAIVDVGVVPELPTTAKLQECPAGVTACMKSYASVITNNDGQEKKELAYLWSCATYGNLMTATAPCGAKFEITTGGPNPDGKGTITAYTRSCLCCGDECNGKSMNGECNDEPVFTHKCYSNDIGVTESVTAELPITALEVPATANQACMKFSRNDNATDKSSYRWGAVSAPKGKCDWIGTNIEEGRFEKACLCCGDLCNGRRMNPIDAKTIDCSIPPVGPQTTPQPAKLACYTHQATVGVNVVPELPATAKLQECPVGVTACMKAFYLTTTVENGKETKVANYRWGCPPFGKLLMTTAPCGATLEVTTGHKTEKGNAIHYVRSCFCCGDGCNDQKMSAQCNGEPQFTKQCYSHDIDNQYADPQLPKEAFTVPATKDQACMKYSNFDAAKGDGISAYQWGAVTPPQKKCDWSGNHLSGSIFQKACLCCDSLCNGHSLDTIIAKSVDCRVEPPTKPTEPTKPPTTPKPDNLATILGAVLGSALGVTLIILAFVTVKLCRKGSVRRNEMEFQVRGQQ